MSSRELFHNAQQAATDNDLATVRSHVSTFEDTSSEDSNGGDAQSPTENRRMVAIDSQECIEYVVDVDGGDKGFGAEGQRQGALAGHGKSQTSSRK